MKHTCRSPVFHTVIFTLLSMQPLVMLFRDWRIIPDPVPVVTVVLCLILDPDDIAETFTASNLDSSSAVGGGTAIAGYELV